MDNRYEYKVLVEYINPEEKGRTLHLTRIDDQADLTNILEELFEHLPESIPEGWEVNSHNICVCHDTIIVTILLSKPVK